MLESIQPSHLPPSTFPRPPSPTFSVFPTRWFPSTPPGLQIRSLCEEKCSNVVILCYRSSSMKSCFVCDLSMVKQNVWLFILCIVCHPYYLIHHCFPLPIDEKKKHRSDIEKRQQRTENNKHAPKTSNVNKWPYKGKQFQGFHSSNNMAKLCTFWRFYLL